MRTRTSNRTKRFTVEKYDFDESSADEQDAKKASSSRRHKNAEEKDEAFDEDTILPDAESQDDDNDDNVVAVEEAQISDAGIGNRSLPKRAKPTKPLKPSTPRTVGYLDIESLPQDGHQYKAYVGPFERSFRGLPLLNIWYGPQQERLKLAQKLLDRWMGWTVLPPKETERKPGRTNKGVWAPGFFKMESQSSERWYTSLKGHLPSRRSQMLHPEQAVQYQFPLLEMPLLMDSAASPHEVKFSPGAAITLNAIGTPLENVGDDAGEDANIPSGWVLDTGGIVLGMGWAPQSSDNYTQLLALAVIPHGDQKIYNYEEESVKPDFETYGVVQLWELMGEKSDDGYMRPSSKKAHLKKTLCFDGGRARRVKWNPVLRLLAVLSGNGSVYVIEPSEDGDGTYEMVEPLATLSLRNEETIKATSMTWIVFNRIAVGYSDGSIALWSIYPNCLLSRHPVHHNHIIDMVSGYPTVPYVVMSTPVGGVAKLVDLQAPSYETTEVQNSAIHTQPNLLGYSDHILGFFSVYPTANPLNTIIGFMHYTQFPLVRRIFTGDSFLSCLSIGRTHPFLLIGTQDGSLWCVNAQVQIFSSRRAPTDRLRILQHEHRPANLFPPASPASARGVSRILRGFAVDKNRNPKTEGRSGKKGGKGSKKAADDDDDDDDDETVGGSDPSRSIIYEPLSRITVVEWNPNDGFGCWAAAAMASGIVNVLDIGLEG